MDISFQHGKNGFFFLRRAVAQLAILWDENKIKYLIYRVWGKERRDILQEKLGDFISNFRLPYPRLENEVFKKST